MRVKIPSSTILSVLLILGIIIPSVANSLSINDTSLIERAKTLTASETCSFGRTPRSYRQWAYSIFDIISTSILVVFVLTTPRVPSLLVFALIVRFVDVTGLSRIDR